MKEKIKKLIHKSMMTITTVFITLMTIFGSAPMTVQAANEKVVFTVNKADEVLKEAQKHLGKPYVWGANGPNSFDCSGFVSYVFKQVGLKFNEDRFSTYSIESYLDGLGVDSYQYSTNTANPANVKAGDVILYYDSAGEPIHMSIYMGNGKIIHCAAEMPSGPTQQVMISNADALGQKHGTSIVTYKAYRVFPDKGGVRLKKTDEFGNTLSGVEFKITYPNGTVRNAKTDENGVWDSDALDIQLPPGTYKYQEVSTKEGYLLDDTIRSFTITAGVKASQNIVMVTNKEPSGQIKIIKTNTNGDRIANTSFKLYARQTITNKAGSKIYYNSGQLVTTLTTNANGEAVTDKLPLGNYLIEESSVPVGYVLNTNSYHVDLSYKDQVTSLITESTTIKNEDQKGKINLKKSINASLTNGNSGDASLQGNSYALYADQKITNVAGTVTYYQKDQLISIKKTSADGSITWDKLPLGKYYMKETTNNQSLMPNNEIIKVELTYAGQSVSETVTSAATQDRVNMQKIQVFKSGDGGGTSGVVKGLKGAEFTWKLNSDVDAAGWNNAKTYAVITTGDDGKANTPYLPYGKYLVRETKTPQDYAAAPDFTVSVTADYTQYTDVEQVKKIHVNNAPFSSQVKLIKVDKVTGEKITLNSASFKIKDSSGKYVVQKVAGKKYDTFTTNSKNQIIPFTEQGTTTLPLKLLHGTYTVEEIKIPEGFLALEKSLTFTITSQYDYDVDEDEEPMLEVIVENEQPKGRIELEKTDKETANPLDNVEYTLIAKDTIFNMINGDILYQKGDVVSKGKTNSNGRLSIQNLPMGHYELKETLTKDGYVLSEKIHQIVLDQKDETSKEYVSKIDVTNIAPKGEINLVKKDKDTSELLSGVIYQLKAKEDIVSLDGRNHIYYHAGDAVSKDISEDGRYITNELGELHITDLPLGHYELKEIQPLAGYYENKVSYDIDLTYDHSDKTLYTENLEATNTKTIVEVSKVEVTDEQELEGAKLSLYDKDDKLVEEWESGREPHIIRGLFLHTEYRFHEDLAPLGYATASDIIFSLDTSGEPTKVIMKDEVTKTEIVKVDEETSEAVSGAVLRLTEKDTGDMIKQWTSSEKAQTFEGLMIGKTYVLHEEKAPAGYHKTEDVEFVIKDTGDVQKFMMGDRITKVVIEKQDASSKAMLEGAILEVIDKATGKSVDKWITTNEGHVIKGLEVGKTYVLKEFKAPSGYEKAKDMEFTLKEEDSITKIVMVDERKPISTIETGDETMILPIAAVFAGAGIAAFVLYRKAKKD